MVTERPKVLGEGTVSSTANDQVDGAALAKEIEDACNHAEASGLEIISILTVDRGRKYYDTHSHSITAGVIITARRTQDTHGA